VRALEVMVAFSAGFMISVVVLDLIPKSLAVDGDRAALVILAGYLLVHLTPHPPTPQFHFDSEPQHATTGGGFYAVTARFSTPFMARVALVIALAVHRDTGIL